jgi:hypothetical protein
MRAAWNATLERRRMNHGGTEAQRGNAATEGARTALSALLWLRLYRAVPRCLCGESAAESPREAGRVLGPFALWPLWPRWLCV